MLPVARASRDIDGQTDRSKWAGAHESIFLLEVFSANETQLRAPATALYSNEVRVPATRA